MSGIDMIELLIDLHKLAYLLVIDVAVGYLIWQIISAHLRDDS